MDVMYHHINMHRRANCSHSCLWAANVKFINSVQQAMVIHSLCFHNVRSKCPPVAFTHSLVDIASV